MMSKKLRRSITDASLSLEEQKSKINDIRKMIGPIANKIPGLCSDASITRYLRARNWNTKKAAKMLKDTRKWRLEFKPEKIRWDDVSKEAQTGKVYKANYFDKRRRTVLVLRPGFQNTTGIDGQIRHLVYCMENAIMTMKPEHEQMVWLIDFQRWKMGSISIKAARETAKILQNHYPERLGLAILYNPPKVFESFWMMVKPFIEPKTYKKVRFVYPNDPQSEKLMQELFEMEKLESAFGGKNLSGFNFEAYGKWMKEEEKKIYEANNLETSAAMPSLTSEELSKALSPAGDDDDDGSSSADECEYQYKTNS